MKKLLILVLVLGMIQVGWAVPTAWFQVDPADAKDSYEPSDEIGIGMVADFYVGLVGIDKVWGEPAASNPYFNPLLDSGGIVYPCPGTVINAGGVLVQAIMAHAIGLGDVPPGEIIWGFTYHVPDVPASTILTISATGVDIADSWYMDFTNEIIPLELHVVPEPATIALLGLGGLLLRRRR